VAPIERLHLIQPYFGSSSKGFSRLVWRLDAANYSITPLVLSSKNFSIEDAGENYEAWPFASIYYRSLPSVDMVGKTKNGPTQFDMTAKWTPTGAAIPISDTLRIHAHLNPHIDLVPHAEKFDYDSIWKSGQLAGLVIAGQNLSSESSAVIEQYREYYAAQGFQFSAPIAVPNLKSFIIEKLKSDDLSYVVKEAHAASDQFNVVTLGKAGRYRVGQKKSARGNEIVYLVDSDPDDSDQFTNAEFGALLHERKTPIIFLNTSCWSINYAYELIQAAENPLFTLIPSRDMVRFFYNGVTPGGTPSAIRIILDGIRKGRTFAQMRQGLQSVPNYRNGTEDTFTFPDETAYDAIRDKLDANISVNVDEISKPTGL
jgi:hypothetical protein